MPIITQITQQKRRPQRRNIFIDGRFAFGVNVNVVARFRLVVGMTLDPEQTRGIEQGEVRQECFDAATRLLEQRLHATDELRRKLSRHEFGPAVIQGVLDDLQRLGYLNDDRFAEVKAHYAAQHKHHGRRRALIELIKSGVDRTTADRALERVYETHDSMAVATELARKQAPRLKRLDPVVGRRRLTGMLLRRGFDLDTIRPVIEQTLGHGQADEEFES